VGLILVVAGLFLGGCGFFGRQFTNFTAYYNKFHNANEAFEKGLQSMEEQRERPVDRTQYVSLFPATGAQQGNESPFDKAIQKSADVLREHPDSKWVDDALLLIGKSYFYQQNYVGAAQKFREVIALNGEKTKEARFWLARTLVATGRYGAASEVIRTGIEGSPTGPWTARLHLVRGQLLVQQEQWEEATQALNQGLQGDVPDDVAARAAFLLGQALETIGQPSPARAAYQEVQTYDPSYPLRFAARLNDVELQGIHGDAARALDRLRDLETDEKNFEQRGEMAVVRARIHRAQGQYDQARAALTGTLYGQESASGASRGRLHYDLARLYRDAYKDFSRAAAHFDTASTSLESRQAPDGGETQRLPTAPVDAGAQANRYRDLAERARTVARLDSLLRLGRMSDRAFQEFVADLRRRRQAEQAAEREERSSRSRRLRSRGQALAERRQEASPAADTRSSDAGFLFHKDPARVQRGTRQFEQTWGDRPLVDNWRRQVAIRSTGSAASAAQDADGTSPRDEAGSPSTGRFSAGESDREAGADAGVDLSAIPRDSASLADMEAEQTVARYKLANSLFLAANRPDSAATWYRRILQESGDHPVAKRALYALAEAYRAQGDTTAAQQAYRRLIDQYPDTDLAARARQRLGLREASPADNHRVLADTAYARAYRRWQRGRLDSSLTQFLDLARRYPDTDAAPRALLAAGVVYWKQLQADTLETSRRVLERHLRPTPSEEAPHPDSSARRSTQDLLSGGGPNERSDSLRTAPADTAVARSDSTGRPRPPADSARAVGSRPGEEAPRAGVDSTAGPPPDSARVPADSAGAGTPTTAVDSTRRPPSSASEPSPYAPLEALMASLTERYPDAPQVARARSILELIEKRRKGGRSVLADTTAADTAATDAPAADAAVRDTTTQDTPVRDTPGRDTAAVAGRRATPYSSTPPDTGRTARSERGADDAAERDRTPLPAPTDRRAGDDPGDEQSPSEIDPAQGGWTLLVETFSSSQDASTRLARVGQRLGEQWPVDVLKETREDGPQYRLVVGQFQSRRAAARARKRVATQLSSRPQVWSLSGSAAPQ
jgi:TolA-binding protein